MEFPSSSSSSRPTKEQKKNNIMQPQYLPPNQGLFDLI